MPSWKCAFRNSANIQINLRIGKVRKKSKNQANDKTNLKKSRHFKMADTITSNVDAAFVDINRSFTSFLIWRIENLHVVPVPIKEYGKFYDGDSYLIFAASEPGKTIGPKTKPYKVYGYMEQHIHFWLGKHTSLDEAAVAAYKAIELDTYLGGAPVQHREEQGGESNRFKGYFKNGIRYLTGGVATGLNHVTKTSMPKLFQVKGKRSPSVTQMPGIDWKYFNSGDVFILDTDDEVIFIWIGRAANYMEKLQATKVAQQMKLESNAVALIFVEDGKELALPENEKTLLGVYLDLRASVGVKGEITSDEKAEKIHYNNLKLYHCSDEDGTYKISEKKMGPLYQSDLKSEDAFIIDQNGRAIWVWVGKGASDKERTESIRNAHGFVLKKNYEKNIPVTRVIEGGEPVEFKCLFHSWRDSDEVAQSYKKYSVGKIAHLTPSKVDMATLHKCPELAASTRLIDDGTGTKTIWRINDVELVPVEKSMHGIFYSGDCYLIHYKYDEGDILYYWLGSHRSIKEQTALTIQTIMKDNQDLQGNGVQVRVVQGKESTHFLAMFSGRAIILKGDHQDKLENSFLLQVTGNNDFNTKAIQVNMRASCLNSNDVFILKKEKAFFIWCGKGSTGDEREMAKLIAKRLSNDEFNVIFEGQEKSEFWEAIGGKQEYANSKPLASLHDPMPPRLFQISNATGKIAVDEIMNFSQSDLVPEDVMLLDARDIIFLWLGSKANKEEIKQSSNLAIEYLKTDPSNRDLDTPIMVIKQGYEPVTFTGFFGAWDSELWKDYQSYEELRNTIESENPTLQVEVKVSEKIEDFDTCQKHPYESLITKDVDQLPAGVDPTHKEVYLSKEDFVKIFKMNYTEFSSLQKWKKDKLKQCLGLF